MGQDYSEVVQRLQAYRRAQHKTQAEMSADMGVTQSHYAKLESGTNIISYDCLKTFEMNGGDVHFLITGQRPVPGHLDHYMEHCRTDWGSLQMFRIILWIVDIGISLERRTELSEMVSHNLRLAQMELDHPGNIWKNIRRLNGLTQFQMADILGINIKRYQRLEKQVTKPDAEILYRLYSGLSYAPMLLMMPNYYYMRECNDVWEHFPQKLRDRLSSILDQAAELIGSSETGG